MTLRLHALVVFMLRHFFAALFLDGTHLDFSFGLRSVQNLGVVRK
jgi:hypothetical protein